VVLALVVEVVVEVVEPVRASSGAGGGI
jgi:hypothetical protein